MMKAYEAPRVVAVGDFTEITQAVRRGNVATSSADGGSDRNPLQQRAPPR